MPITLNSSLVSSSARKLPIRKRPDLEARRQRYQGRAYWIVKDPVGMHYFRFQEEEYAILQMLDGRSSLDEIKDQFEADFPPQKITLDELEQFLGMLHRSGLIIAGVQGQGTQLLKRRQERRRKELLAAAANILCIRFKGIDPERAFNWLHPKIRWFFHPVTVTLCILLGLAALGLVLVNFDTFRNKLPEFQQFFSPANAFLLAIVLGVTKVLHEFGHGLSCKHFGGECHELGVMILVLTPCLYCNVSDSWMLPNKWHRAFIGAAGMYVELVLASICTFIWWNTETGLLHHLALNVMFVSSISTVIFNANPLLRYDGYYILSDLTEIPNLRQKATTILGRKAGEWFLGLEPQEDPFLPERNQVFFALYAVAAAIYRWVVVLSILWFLWHICKTYKLETLGRIVVMASLYGLVVQPLYQVGKFFHVPGRLDKIKRPRLVATLCGAGAILGFILFVRLPYSVMCTVEIEARDPERICAMTPGELVEVYVKPGQWVEAGQKLARLSNPDVDLKVADQLREIRETQGRRECLEQQLSERGAQGSGRAAAYGEEINKLDKELKSLREKLKEAEEEQAKLCLRASRSGYVLPPPGVFPPREPDGPLPTWSGTPLERNLGAHLEKNTEVCLIGNPRELKAVLVVEQGDFAFVHAGQRASIKLDQLPDDVLEGTVEKTAETPLRASSKRMSSKFAGELATKTDATGVERPITTSYEAYVPLDNPDLVLRLGARGRGKIHMQGWSEWQTLGGRFWRMINRTFNFKL